MEQAAQRQVEKAWGALNMRLRVVLNGGAKTLELTGRQVVGLHGHAAKSPSGQVAFEHEGVMETLSLGALEKLKQSLEAKALGSVPKPQPRPRPASAVDLAEMYEEEVRCTFTFLDLAALREAYEDGRLRKLPCMHWVASEHPEWLVEEELGSRTPSATPTPTACSRSATGGGGHRARPAGCS